MVLRGDSLQHTHLNILWRPRFYTPPIFDFQLLYQLMKFYGLVSSGYSMRVRLEGISLIQPIFPCASQRGSSRRPIDRQVIISVSLPIATRLGYLALYAGMISVLCLPRVHLSTRYIEVVIRYVEGYRARSSFLLMQSHLSSLFCSPWAIETRLAPSSANRPTT